MEKNSVAYCGLYCGACGKFKKGRCAGCYNHEKASWCKIRTCCIENGYSTCADCKLEGVLNCKKYNNFIAGVIGFITCTDRSKCIERIKNEGIEAVALDMAANGKMSIKK